MNKKLITCQIASIGLITGVLQLGNSNIQLQATNQNSILETENNAVKNGAKESGIITSGEKVNITPQGSPNQNLYSNPQIQSDIKLYPVEGERPVGIIFIEFEDVEFETDLNDIYKKIFNVGNNQNVQEWIEYESGGKFSITPLETSNEGLPKGAFKVKLTQEDVNLNNVGSHDFQKQEDIFKAALNKIKDEIDWKALDTNNDNMFRDPFLDDLITKDAEEVNWIGVFAGDTTNQGDGSSGPEVWPHVSKVEGVYWPIK